MSNEIKKLGSDTLIYGLGTILPRALNFLLVFIHTRVFPNQEAYGTISELYGYVAFLNIVFLFGMETAFFRFANKQGMKESKIFRIAQTVVLFISILLSGIFLLTSNRIAVILHTSSSSIVWLSLTMLVDAIVAIPFARLRQQKKSKLFALYKVINVVVLVGLNFFLLNAYSSPTIELVFLANFLANSVYLIFFLKELFSWRPLFDRNITPEILKYSYPLVITGLAGTNNEMFSRIALDNWLPENFYQNQTPKQAQGVFAACYKFSVFMSIAVQAFRFAAEPFFFSKAEDKKSPALFANVNHYFILFACVITIGICLNLDWLKYFVAENYWSGLNIVPILLFGYMFQGIYFNISIWFKLTDKTYFGTVITIIGAVLTVAFNYWLIPVYGIIGSSMATLFVYSSMTAICYWLGQKYFPVPYSVVKDLLLLMATAFIVYLNLQIEIVNPWISMTSRGLVSLLILGLVLKFIQKNLQKS